MTLHVQKESDPIPSNSYSSLSQHHNDYCRKVRPREYTPEGKERREFPKTRVRTPTNLRILEDDKDDENREDGEEDKKTINDSTNMGGGDERYYGTTSRSNRCSGNSSREFQQHYTDPYGRSRAYHPHPPTSNTRRSRGDLYSDSKNSPYHHGIRRSDRSGDYLILRQQQQQQQQQQQAAAAAAAAAAEYDRIQHHSGSRTDLLEHDHNSIYDHYTPPPPNQYSFVRTCDGNFVKTFIPPNIHKYDSGLDGSSSSSYRANHTLRRPSKRSHHPSSSSTGGGSSSNTDYCCRDESGYSSIGGPPQSYATLRGRKWTEKARGSCGDNYGRLNYLDPDSRSVTSFTDDFLALPPPLASSGVGTNNNSNNNNNNPPQGIPNNNNSILLRTLTSAAGGGRILSRSTDRNLDNLGLSDEEILVSSTTSPSNNSNNLQGIRCSDEVLSLLIREPPDGKEKPEPASGKNNKLTENSHLHHHHGGEVVRKGSKAELIEAASRLASSDGTSGVESTVGGKTLVLSGPKADIKRDSLKESLYDIGNPTEDSLDPKEWKPAPNSPRCGGTSGNLLAPSIVHSAGSSGTGAPSSSSSTSAKTTVLVAAPTNPQRLLVPRSSSQTPYIPPSSANSSVTPGLSGPSHVVGPSSAAILQQQQQQLQQPPWHETLKKYVVDGTAEFFGVDENREEAARSVWTDRRRRLAIKRFGGVKDELNPGYQLDNNAYNPQYSDCSRLRYDHHLTSEMEGDKMVLKITKPPRNKDSFSSLTRQSLSWLIKAFMTRKIPSHHVVMEHEVSRSYQPSTTGIAAYYQAEQSGGLAVCPPLPRVPSTHHLHGEGPAEEVFFTKPSLSGCENDSVVFNSMSGKRVATDPYRPSCSWQLPRPEQDLPRMSSDVGASRIWNRLLDAAFDNSDRRKHGMGVVGRLLYRKRPGKRRGPAAESSRRRKLAGNSMDYRPYFTYWITFVQIFVLLVSILIYGVGPVGVDFYKKAGMVLVTNLELEPVDHMEPANFWIGPSATDLIHLGAKYAPCMRWDESLNREIQEERLKERDTACCIRKDRAGCVQSPKSECSKVSDSTPRSNWWRPSEWGSKYQYPSENRRSSGPVCGLDPAYCEAPASVAPYIWPDDITKWPICRKKTELENLDQTGHAAEHMICEIIGHPCCIGIRGHCQITTREYCTFVSGTFHEEAALCSQVSCLDDVCGLLPFRHRDVPDQFYRAWTPLFLHAGLLHLALTIALQYWLMRDLEKMAGATRISIIYIGSGMIGNLASAIFVPYRAEVGPAGSHFGLLACSIVEVIHEWNTLKYPEMAILKLVGVTSVFFLAGLLPWVDNYAHLFGFIAGFLLSYALLPLVTFGTYNRRRKILIIWICLASVGMLFLGLVLIFYVSPLHECEICRYFNCIPITKDFCADQIIDVRDAI